MEKKSGGVNMRVGGEIKEKMWRGVEAYSGVRGGE